MDVSLLRNNTERTFCIMVEGLDSVPSERYFNRNDEGVWVEYNGTDDPDLDNASATPLNARESIAFLRTIAKDLPDVAELVEGES